MRNVNGWSNHATWCVHHWLTGEEDSYHEAKDTVEDAADPAMALRELVTERAPEGLGLYGDLLLWALETVDWDEIATAFTEEAA